MSATWTQLDLFNNATDFVITRVELTNTLCKSCGVVSEYSICPLDQEIFSKETLCSCCPSCRKICEDEI